MGFGFKIAPGVRVHASSRGLGVGMGVGPVGYYIPPGGARRSSGRSSVAARERQMRAAQRQQEIESVLALDRELIRMCGLHKESFPAAQPPPPAVAGAVDDKAIRRQLEENELQGVPLFRFGERKAAKRQAREKLDAEVAAEVERQEAVRAAEQADLDAAWRRLKENDSDTVLASLEEAFADNESPAVAVSCQGARVDLLMLWPVLDAVVGDRKFATTPTGNPTHRKRSKTDRNEIYLEAMASSALATVKEAFAVAPGLHEAAVLVLRKVEDLAVGDDVIEALYAGVIERTQIEALNWDRISPTAALIAVPESSIGLKGKSTELRAVDLSDDPATIATVNEVAVSLGLRSPYGAPEVPVDTKNPNGLRGTMHATGDPTQLDGVQEAALVILGRLAEDRKGALEDMLILVTQEEGALSVHAFTYDTDGPARAAEVGESFEKYAPLAAGCASIGGASGATLFLIDRDGDERLLSLEVDGAGVTITGPSGDEPPEAQACREGHELARARWSGK